LYVASYIFKLQAEIVLYIENFVHSASLHLAVMHFFYFLFFIAACKDMLPTCTLSGCISLWKLGCYVRILVQLLYPI